MKLYSENENYKLYHGNMLDMLEVIDENSIDSIVTDPPYGLTSIVNRFGKEDSAEAQYGKDGSFQRLSKGFMGKEWDGSGIEYNINAWRNCYKALKPGGYLLAFGGSRTFHRIACAIEDAGFEIRDTIMWLYGAGFPKSMNVGKQLEKRLEDEKTKQKTEHDLRLMWERDIQKTMRNEEKQNEVLQSQLQEQSLQGTMYGEKSKESNLWEEQSSMERWNNIQKTERELQRCKICKMSKRISINGKERWICNGTQISDGKTLREMFEQSGSCSSYRPQSEQQQDRELNVIQEQCRTQESREIIEYWNKFGTALKPSYEPIIVARKPVENTVVDNVLKYGVGGINIDECRVGNEEISYFPTDLKEAHGNKFGNGAYMPKDKNKEPIIHNGRFPANTILTYDDTDFKEVCGGFPTTKSVYEEPNKNHTFKGNKDAFQYGYKDRIGSGYEDSGSASRYFMNCKYTGKDEEIWKQLLVNNVENNLEILKVTKDNIAQMNVEDLLKELKDHYAKYVENQQDLIETSIVQDIVKMLTWDFKIETSQVIQDFIINSKKCIQFLNLVQFVEKMDNIDTTQTTQNLLKLFGYVKAVITNYIQGNIEYDQKRYIYTPKASKKDRDDGLDEFEDTKGGSYQFRQDGSLDGEIPIRKNIHPTVKPMELMQYLIRLVTPRGGTILDPFNGSGSTGKAVMYENAEKNKDYKYIGIELTEEYLPISKARIESVKYKKIQTSLF